MAYDRKPLYHFTDATKTGIDKVPKDRVLYMEDTAILYTKVNDTGLSPTSTITDAITNGNIVELIDIVGGKPSGSEIFRTSGTWTAPDGVTDFQVILCSGGGGGAAGACAISSQSTNEKGCWAASGGSGGPGYAEQYDMCISSVRTINVVVGAGGAGGVGGSLSANVGEDKVQSGTTAQNGQFDIAAAGVSGGSTSVSDGVNFTVLVGGGGGGRISSSGSSFLGGTDTTTYYKKGAGTPGAGGGSSPNGQYAVGPYFDHTSNERSSGGWRLYNGTNQWVQQTGVGIPHTLDKPSSGNGTVSVGTGYYYFSDESQYATTKYGYQGGGGSRSGVYKNHFLLEFKGLSFVRIGGISATDDHFYGLDSSGTTVGATQIFTSTDTAIAQDPLKPGSGGNGGRAGIGDSSGGAVTIYPEQGSAGTDGFCIIIW